MPLRRTERSDGRVRPRWKDGSHVCVENTSAEKSPCAVIAPGIRSDTQLLVEISSSLRRGHGSPNSTRGRSADAGADARIEESAANGEVRLAILPYGKHLKSLFRSEKRDYVKSAGDGVLRRFPVGPPSYPGNEVDMEQASPLSWSWSGHARLLIRRKTGGLSPHPAWWWMAPLLAVAPLIETRRARERRIESGMAMRRPTHEACDGL